MLPLKKSPKYFILYYFSMKNSCFWHKKPFLIFLAQVRTKWISDSCSTAFLGPLYKNLGGVHFFFFLLELFASGIPDRIIWIVSPLSVRDFVWTTSGDIFLLFGQNFRMSGGTFFQFLEDSKMRRTYFSIFGKPPNLG